MASSYPTGLDELTNGVPSDGSAAATPLGSGTYPHDDHHRLLGEAVEAMQAQMQGAFTSYTPTLTADSVDPTLGSGSTATGYYKRMGHRVEGYAQIVFGSTGAAAGTGNYGLLLPVEPVNRNQPIGIGFVLDYSDTLRCLVASATVAPTIWASSTRKATLIVSNAAASGFGTGANPMGAAAPWTWAANDQILVSFAYEAAAAS